MWLYSGPKDVTQINAAKLSDKEILDEVRPLTHFIQEHSIPLVALQDPYEITHLPAEVILILHTRYDTLYLIALFWSVESLFASLGARNCKVLPFRTRN
jgi:hypothetical protein